MLQCQIYLLLAKFKRSLDLKTIVNPDNVSLLDGNELLALLQEKDYHASVRHEDVISDSDLQKLLDRSDMYRKWNKMRNPGTFQST